MHAQFQNTLYGENIVSRGERWKLNIERGEVRKPEFMGSQLSHMFGSLNYI